MELIEMAYTPEELGFRTENRAHRFRRVDLSDPIDCLFKSLWNNPRTRSKCRTILLAIKSFMQEGETSFQMEVIEKRFMEIRRLLKLSDLEYNIFVLAYCCQNTCFCWPCRVENREKPFYYAMALDRSYSEVQAAMTAKNNLIRYRLLDRDWDFDRRTLGGYVDGSNEGVFQHRFYKKDCEENLLPWNYYGELAAGDGETIKRMMKASGGKLNILLYGAPGTGKTSFARSIAHELGLQIFEIRQGDKDGDEISAASRLAGIQICNERENPGGSMIIVDEADELLRCGAGGFSFLGFSVDGRHSTEKGVMNSILDSVKIPTIWISNAPACEMDESVRRRFDYSVCFEELNTFQRESIWRNLVEKYELGSMITPERIAEYAAKYETSAGGISIVLENVKRMGLEGDAVDAGIAKLMKPHCRLMGIRETNRFLPAKGYSLDGLNIKGNVGLQKVLGVVRNYLHADFNERSADRPRMNILLFGAPGTGETEFVKYLGRHLGRKVMVMKGSDLLSKWVGESEQNIAQAFRRTEQERAVLFFDEVDGLLQSRERAQVGWEITQVNELLQQMENFDGVMIAATNFCKDLDAAVMRRFTFKLEFDYLDDAGKKIFFERMFETRLTDAECAELKALRNLAPGDFRTVRQAQFYLDTRPSNHERIAALREECRLKKDGDKSAHIGFGT